MGRLTMTLLATAAAAALAATAVVALPAIGDSGTTGADQGPEVSTSVGCLAKHGLPGAPTSAAELKAVAQGQRSARPGRAPCGARCLPVQRAGRRRSRTGPATLIACVRSHGFDAPTSPVDFKRWVGQKHEAGDSAVDDAVVACNDTQHPQGFGDTKPK